MATAKAHASKPRRRTIRAARVEGAAGAIGPVEPGCEVFVLTHGQFSLIDGIVYLSQQIGPCRLSVSTWTAGNEDLQAMANLLAAGQFASCRWLVDRSFLTRQPAYCARLRELFGDDVIRTTRSHAKFVTLRNERFDLAVRTSMNLNHNPRLEDIEISDDPALADFLDRAGADPRRDRRTGVSVHPRRGAGRPGAPGGADARRRRAHRAGGLGRARRQGQRLRASVHPH